MSDKVRIGVIGVGMIGKHHLNIYQSKVPNAEVVALCDIDTTELQMVSEHFKVKDTYVNFRDLLKRDDIQAVDVCLHNNKHMAVTLAALEADKHVYCEKPMAGAYPDAVKMVETAKATGKKFSVQLATLFASETKAAKALIDAGRLGHVYHMRSTGFRRRGRPYVDGYGRMPFVSKYEASGGAMYDMGVYHIAQLLYLTGNPVVERVCGKTYQEIAMDARRRELSGYSVEELGLGFVRFKDNLSMDIIESWAIHLNDIESSVIVGSEGGIRLDPFGFYYNLGDLDFNIGSDMDGMNWRLHNVHEIGDEYDGPQQHWVAALQGRVPLLPTAELALNTMFISQGIYLSEELGREVTADEIRTLSKSSAIKL
jgi:predicted dehydrogenase